MVSNLLVLLLPAASALFVRTTGPKCIDIVVPVHIESQSYPLKVPILKNGYESTELVLQATKRDGKRHEHQLIPI